MSKLRTIDNELRKCEAELANLNAARLQDDGTDDERIERDNTGKDTWRHGVSETWQKELLDELAKTFIITDLISRGAKDICFRMECPGQYDCLLFVRSNGTLYITNYIRDQRNSVDSSSWNVSSVVQNIIRILRPPG